MFKSGSVDGLSVGKMDLQMRIAKPSAVIVKGMSLVLQIQLEENVNYPRNRPWRPIGL
jgi:hypothetical protein